MAEKIIQEDVLQDEQNGYSVSPAPRQLSPRDSALLLNAIETPREPSEALKQAAARFKRRLPLTPAIT